MICSESQGKEVPESHPKGFSLKARLSARQAAAPVWGLRDLSGTGACQMMLDQQTLEALSRTNLRRRAPGHCAAGAVSQAFGSHRKALTTGAARGRLGASLPSDRFHRGREDGTLLMSCPSS